MEKQVIFRPDQHVKAVDLSNMEDDARASIDHVVNDGIDSGKKYWGLTGSQTGPTEVTIAPGRYYTGGQVYVGETSTVFSLIANLPVATQKIGTVVAWGLEQEENIEPRAFLINADTNQFEPREVTMRKTRALQLDVIYGLESASPARGTIPSTVIPVADILLNNAGVVSVTMDDSTRLRSVHEAQVEIDDLTTWRAVVGIQLDTLKTDMAKIRASIPPDLSSAVAGLAGQIATILNILKRPVAAIWNGVDRFVNLEDSDTAHSGYSAKIEDGLRFPPGTSAQAAVQLLNPIEPKVVTVSNIFRTKSYIYMTTFPVVARSWVRRHLSRYVVRYGEMCVSTIDCVGNGVSVAMTNLVAKSVVVDQGSVYGLAEIARRPDWPYYLCQRVGGEIYTNNWLGF